MGAAHGLRRRVGAPVAPIELAGYEQCVKELKDKLTAEAYKAAWEAGKAMTSEQMFAEAAEMKEPDTL